MAAGIGAVPAEAGIGIGTGVAEGATDGAGNAVDGTAIAIDVVSPRGKFRGHSVLRISTKNRRQRDMNLPCDSSA